MTTHPPANWFRQVGLSVVLAVSCTAVALPAAAQGTREFARVRSTHSAIATLLTEGRDRSATFRKLVDTIEASDGIVYIEEGNCRHGVRACLLLSVTLAGNNRVLRVLVDTRKADWDLMGSVGHEMRHAIEVLSNPSITNNPAIYNFYREHSTGGRDVFETEAAIQAGLDVRAEARKALSRTLSH